MTLVFRRGLQSMTDTIQALVEIERIEDEVVDFVRNETILRVYLQHAE